MNDISQAFKKHYTSRVVEHGPNAAGVDWIQTETANVTYRYMIELFRDSPREAPIQLLDVGCGYGGLLAYAKEHGFTLDYTGIDIVPEMIEHGRHLHPDAKFILGDFTTMKHLGHYDYVTCNGILTLKLAASILDMHKYADSMIRKMFDACKIGMCFNVMTTRVNFQIEDSYYRSPVETLAFCLSELSNKVKIDHNHPRYQFTTYVYRE
jgi:SAM-dependent methyltransferase